MTITIMWMNFENVMLSQKSETKKVYCTAYDSIR